MRFDDQNEVFSTPKKKNKLFAAVMAQIKRDKSEQAVDDEEENEEEAASEKLEDFFGKDAFDSDGKRPKKPSKPLIDFSALTKNRLYIGIACMVLALFIGFVFVPMSAHLASIKTVTVLRAKQDIPMGSVITADMLNQVQISAQNVPETMVKDAEQAVGKYADKDIVKDENILSTKLVDEPPIGEEYLAQLPNGDLAVSISVKSFAAGLSGKLLPGDIVSVYANLANNNEYDYRSSLVSELYYVEVLSVTNEEIGDTFKAEPDPENPDEEQDTLPTTVTLRCINLEQARVLIGLEANSTIHLALICRNNNNYKQQLLTAQKNYFVLLAEQQAQMQQSQQNSAIPGESTAPGDSDTSSKEEDADD